MKATVILVGVCLAIGPWLLGCAGSHSHYVGSWETIEQRGVYVGQDSAEAFTRLRERGVHSPEACQLAFRPGTSYLECPDRTMLMVFTDTETHVVTGLLISSPGEGYAGKLSWSPPSRDIRGILFHGNGYQIVE